MEEVIDALQKELENFFRSDDIAKCEEFIGKYKYIQCALVNVRKKLEKIKEDERISLL